MLELGYSRAEIKPCLEGGDGQIVIGGLLSTLRSSPKKYQRLPAARQELAPKNVVCAICGLCWVGARGLSADTPYRDHIQAQKPSCTRGV